MITHNPTFILLLSGIGIMAGLSQQLSATKEPAKPEKTVVVNSVSAPALYPTIILAASHSK